MEEFEKEEENTVKTMVYFRCFVDKVMEETGADSVDVLLRAIVKQMGGSWKEGEFALPLGTPANVFNWIKDHFAGEECNCEKCAFATYLRAIGYGVEIVHNKENNA